VLNLTGTVSSIGAVFTTASVPTVKAIAQRFRLTGTIDRLMFDRGRYAGKNRTMAQSGINRGWIELQRGLGIRKPLTDSGYIGEGDADGLAKILTQTMDCPAGTVAVLPLHKSWWEEGNRQVLTALVNEHAVPVALVLEHADDPFSSEATVRGVIHLLSEVAVTVDVLRTDVSGLGCLAFGASAVAVGTTTALRHLFPIKQRGGGGRNTSIAALWAPGLAYRKLERIADAMEANDDPTLWNCPCDVCYLRSLEWILNSVDQQRAAYEHSVALIAYLAADILAAEPGQARHQAWESACRTAQYRSYEVTSVSGSSWEPKGSINAWVKAMHKIKAT
jgi:hypothetical protein